VFRVITKHMEMQHHFVCEKVLSREVKVEHVSSADQVADIFTKPLGKMKFANLRNDLAISKFQQLLLCK